MHCNLVPATPRPTAWPGDASPSRPSPSAAADTAAVDAGFFALQQGYRAAGGLLRGDELGRTGPAGADDGYIALARRLVAGQLFSFHWHDSVWLPRFQFEADRHTPRQAPRRVLQELREVFDGWRIARWYLQAHPTLGRQRPLDLLESDLPAVLAAARAERWGAAG